MVPLMARLPLTLVAFTTLFAAACATGPAGPEPSPTSLPSPEDHGQFVTAAVIGVIDGVTIEVEAEGQAYRVRYLGVDLPDTGLVDKDARPLSEEALEFNRFLVRGRTVELERDDVESDLSGSLLRYVYVGGEMVNLALIANGYATVADFPATFAYQTEFQVAEERAKASLRGLWRPPRPGDRGESSAQHPTPTDVPRFFGGTLPAPPEAVGASEICDYSGTAEPVIKGNVDSRTGERIYHLPGSLFYSTVVVDETQGDRWFCTEGQAVAAGWKRSKR
jgi:micrococcal nuclease